MSLVDIARRVVLRTNQWPGLKSLYCQAYDLGLAFTVNRLSSVPGVLAVMLRANDDGQRAWVPGLSDYDVTVLTERHDGPQTIRLLDHLWQQYRAIKKHVPQLGEMEVLDVEEYGDFLDFGPLPLSSVKYAYPLFVRAGNGDVERVLQRVPRRPQPQEILIDALSRFGRFVFPAWLGDDGRADSLTQLRTEHLLRNVVKRLARLGVPAETAGSGPLADRMIRVFQALSRACRVMTPSDDGPQPVVQPASLIAADALPPIQSFCEEALRKAAIRCCSAVVWVSYMSVDRLNLVFVVPDNVPEDELRALLVALRGMNRSRQELMTKLSAHNGAYRYVPLSFPTVASMSTWRFWRELTPFEGVAVAVTGRALIGATDHRGAAPSLASLRRGAEVEYASLLTLKNNWRLSGGRPPGPSYAALVNHVTGCTSVFGERVLTVPAPLEFTSTEDGYLASVQALTALRARLVDR